MGFKRLDAEREPRQLTRKALRGWLSAKAPQSGVGWCARPSECVIAQFMLAQPGIVDVSVTGSYITVLSRRGGTKAYRTPHWAARYIGRFDRLVMLPNGGRQQTAKKALAILEGV